MSEARIDRLEDEIRASLARLEPMITRIEATLPHLATKAELADLRTELLTALGDKPGRLYMWGVVAGMTGAYTAALAAAVLALTILQARQPPALMPLACRELEQEQRTCAAGGLAACDQPLIERLQRQCAAFGPLEQRTR
jgi:hypothetical protein